MEHEFWHGKWKKGELGFHQSSANRMLVAHLPVLGLAPGGRIFLPLCGKTLDIHWLLAQGCHVIGAELSELAVVQLFEELSLAPEITRTGPLKRYSADRIDVFVGDIFELTAAMTGRIDAVYDRAALVALPSELRGRYADHLAEIAPQAPHLLVSFEYDQSIMPGPPFSVDAQDVSGLYGARYDLHRLERAEVPGGLKGVCPATEIAWHLVPRP